MDNVVMFTDMYGEKRIQFSVPVNVRLEDFNDAFREFDLDAPEPIEWLSNEGIARLSDMYSANMYEDISWLAEGDSL